MVKSLVNNCIWMGGLAWCILLSELVRALRSSSGRAQFYSVSKKRQGLSTKTEMDSQEVAEEIHYIAIHVQYNTLNLIMKKIGRSLGR
ncbi:hypothetical protein VN97_g8745 [Penicillium thymicola]|uniref:Uncharacterized protein n=1 Tax=Penicillium thymicola TaxID=293382 RepID=A0AAI9TCH2_PENTH|nr:hypothetical protein VN97_g8745 [Penicillium thymicola]